MIKQHQGSGWKCVGYALMLVLCGVGFAALALGESLGFFPTMILLAIVGVFSLVLCYQHYTASAAHNDARRSRTARNGNIVADGASKQFREVVLHGPVPEGMELVKMGFVWDPVLRPVDQGTERPLIDFFSPDEIAAAEWRREYVKLAELPAFHPDDVGHHPLPDFDDPRWGASPREADEKVQKLRLANLPADGDCGEKLPEDWKAVCFGK
jgi:hypothetical protein